MGIYAFFLHNGQSGPATFELAIVEQDITGLSMEQLSSYYSKLLEMYENLKKEHAALEASLEEVNEKIVFLRKENSSLEKESNFLMKQFVKTWTTLLACDGKIQTIKDLLLQYNQFRKDAEYNVMLNSEGTVVVQETNIESAWKDWIQDTSNVIPPPTCDEPSAYRDYMRSLIAFLLSRIYSTSSVPWKLFQEKDFHLLVDYVEILQIFYYVHLMKSTQPVVVSTSPFKLNSRY